ncbi:MAG: 2-succinyl-5-enolpyruvyl-6-hydroxy-3-cyclohexene-1-carboxylic-acid synthase [Ardenticatenaceae bacterium]|nr:2-succinyl-5-enolpyruvyl-6-hydroxy-3-cyclohexene-1-carboxylic-acid synthase [Ardenticatenaceae bacterium]MCB9444447.1 2-succinyl-5-enolpyruvyl-6-hydroxy-3-cyclohexene-1-carboxylic-acid synthase [Ardenticatenaceae bacterium]
MSSSSNPNVDWMNIFVNSLAASGLTAVVIAPGSRSTPLTLAFHAHPDIKIYRHLDERSAGFFALGMALATDKPVALVCTSGTAVVNFFPAIIEAKMSQVPLLILTSDRPHELRHSGANQTIDQVKIYGDQVLWSVDAALPQDAAPEVAMRNLQALAARAYATANGLMKGPVHINFPFRKPLEPESREPLSVNRTESEITDYGLRIEHGRIHPTEAQLDELTAVISQHPRGLIVCGPRCPEVDFPQSVQELAQQTGYPILADPLSGLRFNRRDAEGAEKKSAKSVKSVDSLLVSGYETFLQNAPIWQEPEIIVRFGAVPTSKWLNDYLDRINPALRIHIRANGVWADDGHRTTWFLQADETETCRQLAARLQPRPLSDWAQQVLATEAKTWQKIDTAMQDVYFDGAIVADVVANLPDDSVLVIGNSLPVRHLDQWARPLPKNIRVFGNRGASGIDGNISTALGVAASTDRPVTLIVGDITFYHDMNGLLYLKAEGGRRKTEKILDITIVIINNNGGGIFNRLPVSQFEPPFTELFLTPHGLEFEHAARMYGLDYARVEDRQTFRAVFNQSHTAPRIIEVVTNGRSDHEKRLQIIKVVNQPGPD